MYKDVCKRISAFMLTVCLIVTMVEWPTTVWAGQGTVNTYRNGDGVLAGSAVRGPGCSCGIYSEPQCGRSRTVRQY